jgi:hypothetical protein
MAEAKELTWSKRADAIPRWELDADPEHYQVEYLGVSAYAAIGHGAVLDEFDTRADAQDLAERAYRARLVGGPGRRVTVRRWERAQALGPDPLRELVFQVTGALAEIDGTAVYLDPATIVIEADRSGAHGVLDFIAVSLQRYDLPRQGWSAPTCLVTEVCPAVGELAS